MPRHCLWPLLLVLVLLAGCRRSSSDDEFKAWAEERAPDLLAVYFDALEQQKDPERAEEAMRELIEMKSDLPEKYSKQVESAIMAMSEFDAKRTPRLLQLWKEQK